MLTLCRGWLKSHDWAYIYFQHYVEAQNAECYTDGRNVSQLKLGTDLILIAEFIRCDVGKEGKGGMGK